MGRLDFTRRSLSISGRYVVKQLGLALVIALAATLLAPVAARAATTTSYQFHLELPNVSEDSHGDRVSVTGMGRFTENPKSVSGGGTFTHSFAGGGSVTGTWTADELLEFQS